MTKSKTVIVGLMITLMILISACSTPPSPTPDVSGTVAVNVAVAQTAAILQTNAAMTITASVPTVTPTPDPALLATPTEQFTATPDKIMLTLTRDTYCRTGTSSLFPSVTLLKSGDTVEVLAQNPTGDSFFVVDPKNSSTRCWLWGEYATLSSDQALLRVLTSQPLPTATNTPKPVSSFSIKYVSLEQCGTDYYFRFLIKNTGNFTWQAVQINLYDTAKKFSAVHANTTFVDSTDCTPGLIQSDLTAGEQSNVAAYNTGQFTFDPTGHNITATISLCRMDTFSGCDPASITFTP